MALALYAEGGVFAALAGSEGDAWWIVVLAEATVVTPAAVELVLALRRPGNRVGGLLLINAILLGVLWTIESYAEYTVLAHPGALPGGRWAALASDSDFPLLLAGPVAIALVFTNGRLPSPRWRRVPAAMIAIFALTIVFAAVGPEPFSAPTRTFRARRRSCPRRFGSRSPSRSSSRCSPALSRPSPPCASATAAEPGSSASAVSVLS